VSVRIAPSILSADFAALGEAVAAVERGAADLIHVDVMDGHFVPNITIGPPVVRSLRRVAQIPLDVHLMISDPDRYIEDFAEAGAAMMSVHVEVLPHLHRTVHVIKALGVKAGVALNPSTPVVAIEQIAGDVDFVLVMSVNPGFGGQVFIPRSTSKVREVRALLDRVGNAAAPIAIDGGIDTTTAGPAVVAGARILVAGSAIFDTADPTQATRDLRSAAGAALSASPAAAR
jgi:ribulose-phosphate 3-epimerase